MKLLMGGILLAVAFAVFPLISQRGDLLNLGIQIFLAVALAQSWNLLGGYAGQITLGHAAFFGLGALVTRALWVNGVPLVLALVAGALVATVLGVLIGLPAFRLRGAYFAIGTLGLAEILRITVGNLMPEISTIPAAALASYNMLSRYYLTLGLALLCVTVVAALIHSRVGLGIQAVREDEAAAEASGVGAFRHKLLALALSTALVGLAGGAFAFYHVSYYPQHVFSPVWTFDAVLITFVGGVGTIHGPVLGALFYVILKELLAVRLVELHLLIFGVLFILVVLFLPGGLVEAWSRARRLLVRNSRSRYY
jgi:branched-chain amino acid transport system permease protein